MKPLLLGLCLLLGQSPQAQQSNASIQGIITKLGTGEPLSRARVILSRDGGGAGSLTALTDGGGKFILQNIPAGRYRLFVTRDGYVRAEYGQTRTGRTGTMITLAPRQEMKDAVIAMTPTGAIAGRVFDRYGEPVSNANVQALKYYYVDGKRALTVVQSARTNDLGEYRLFYLQPGQYIVGAVPTEMVRNDGGSFVVDIGPGSPVQMNGGTPGGSIRLGGTVGLASGLVSAADTGETYLPLYYPGTTDAAGAAPIDLRPGANFTGVDFTTAEVRAVRVRGTVIGPGGQTPSVSVTLTPRGTQPTTTVRNAAIANGAFEFRGVAPGLYDLVATANRVTTSTPPPPPPPVLLREAGSEQNRLGARLQIDVGNADIENVALVLQPGYNLTGKIVVDGQPTDLAATNNTFVTNIRVQLRSDIVTGAWSPPTPIPKPDGSFTLPSVFPGEYRFNFNLLPRNSYVKSARMAGVDVLNSGLTIDGEPSGPLEIVIGQNPGSLEAVVLDDNQKPFAAATVVLVPDSSRRQRFELFRPAVSDASGVIHLEGVAPGDYMVFAWEDVESGAWQDPDFIRRYERFGKPIRIAEGGKESLELRLIR